MAIEEGAREARGGCGRARGGRREFVAGEQAMSASLTWAVQVKSRKTEVVARVFRCLRRPFLWRNRCS